MTCVLPDSRLASSQGGVMVDWPLTLPDGTERTVRVECVPVFCGNCGVPYGYVPKDNTTFAFYLCPPCFEKYGEVAHTYALPDDEFNRNVEHEMKERFGRPLTASEIAVAADMGLLGKKLELLIAESPYKVHEYND